MEGAARSYWIRGPLWDTACLAFCWVPVYLWVVFGLGLGGDALGLPELGRADSIRALTLAATVVLALTYVHRHYTFVLVYGDPGTFRQRARAYVVAPLLILAVVWAGRAFSDEPVVSAGGLRLSAWGLVLTASGLWNVWHTVQQRYGLLRIYAARAGQGLETRSHARRDRLLLWSLVLAVVVVLLWLRQETLGGHPSTRQVRQALEPVTGSAAFSVGSAALVAGVVLLFAWWLRHERRACLPLAARVPRQVFFASTVALLAVFFVHGPIVGYLCFGAAHAIEYVAFVHHFGERKFGGGGRSVAALLLRRPLVFAPILIGGLLLAYFALSGVQDTDVYLGYYIVSSMMHFLFDGWIWKVRRPEVARPLGVPG